MIQTRYITLDEFYEYSGIDLAGELKSNANPSDTANSFLHRIEVRMEAFLNAHFFKRITDEWPCFSDYQKEHYKYALMEQAIYVFRNGDITVDSGYEPEQGIVASKHVLRELAIAPNAMEHLTLCGLWSRHISGGTWFGGLWGW